MKKKQDNNLRISHFKKNSQISDELALLEKNINIY